MVPDPEDDCLQPEEPPEALTSERFEALLAWLDPDRERAGERYETIRRKLFRLFEWRGCRQPDELADETLNRVARRLAEGVEVGTGRAYSYCTGVAYRLYKEILRREARLQRALHEVPERWSLAAPEPEEPAVRLSCLQSCLETVLPEGDRRMVLDYHHAEDHIRARRELSHGLGIPLNALRIRVHRACRRLEGCIHQCLQDHGD